MKVVASAAGTAVSVQRLVGREHVAAVRAAVGAGRVGGDGTGTGAVHGHVVGGGAGRGFVGVERGLDAGVGRAQDDAFAGAVQAPVLLAKVLPVAAAGQALPRVPLFAVDVPEVVPRLMPAGVDVTVPVPGAEKAAA